MPLVAKPVIDKQYWIVKDDSDRKVGNVEATAGGYQVKINNQITEYKTIRMVAQRNNIQFETIDRAPKVHTIMNSVHGYPARGRINNPMWDVKHRLPIYTKTTKSKSWFAAGWYLVKKGRHWTSMQDPKLILLQRYQYQGPYHSQEEADVAHSEVR